MEWTDLRFFLAAVRGGNLSAAARELGVNYTTVGRRLDALQHTLGATLIQRTPDGLTLTRAGEAVKELCEKIEATALEVERRAAGQDRELGGTVRLTATETLAARFLIPAMAALRKRHPELEIELIPDYRLLDLSRQQADLAMRNARPADPRLVCRRVGGFAITLYASRAYLAARGTPRRGAGLYGHDLVSWTYLLPATRGQFMGESVGDARIVFRSNSTLGADAFGRRGLRNRLHPVLPGRRGPAAGANLARRPAANGTAMANPSRRPAPHRPHQTGLRRNRRRTAPRVPRAARHESENVIECETRGGFHASFGRGDPCTPWKKSRNVEDDISLPVRERSVTHAIEPSPLRAK